MKSPYRKEGLGTIGFFLLYLIMGHTGLWLAPMTETMNLTILGFPIHYFGAIILGWIGLFIVSVFYVKWADKVDEEIEAFDEQEDQNVFVESKVKVGAAESVGE